jgi:hypothetical protein
MKIEISGTPIAGEDSREDDWVSQIESACSVESITLRFQVEPGRKVMLWRLRTCFAARSRVSPRLEKSDLEEADVIL